MIARHQDTSKQAVIPAAAPQNLQIQFSGVVVTFNEERHLAECLSALSFCSELVVVDVGSTDNSTRIAADHGARIIRHEWVPTADYVREFAVNQTNYDWIILMDPDMIFPQHLLSAICEQILRDPHLGMIGIPYRNYFVDKPVRHGRWGGKIAFPAVCRKDAMELRTTVHRWFRLCPGYNHVVIGNKESDYIKHYWVNSIEHLYQKHYRYIPMEGKVRYEEGERFSYRSLLFQVPYAVLHSLIRKRGILDGLVGIYLSLFNGWWTFRYLLSLREYQWKIQEAEKTTYRL